MLFVFAKLYLPACAIEYSRSSQIEKRAYVPTRMFIVVTINTDVILSDIKEVLLSP